MFIRLKSSRKSNCNILVVFDGPKYVQENAGLPSCLPWVATTLTTHTTTHPLYWSKPFSLNQSLTFFKSYIYTNVNLGIVWCRIGRSSKLYRCLYFAIFFSLWGMIYITVILVTENLSFWCNECILVSSGVRPECRVRRTRRKSDVGYGRWYTPHSLPADARMIEFSVSYLLRVVREESKVFGLVVYRRQ